MWTYVAPLVAQGKMKLIFLECSYDDGRSNNNLYGHLNPKLFMQEIGVLAQAVATYKQSNGQLGATENQEKTLTGLKVVVIHIKSDDLVYNRPQTALSTIQRFSYSLPMWI